MHSLVLPKALGKVIANSGEENVLFWEVMEIVGLAIAECDYLVDQELHFAGGYFINIGSRVENLGGREWKALLKLRD